MDMARSLWDKLPAQVQTGAMYIAAAPVVAVLCVPAVVVTSAKLVASAIVSAPKACVESAARVRRRALILFFAKGADGSNSVLPGDVMAELIFCWLSVLDLGRVAQSCKSLRNVCYRDVVWRSAARHLPLQDPVPFEDVRKWVQQCYAYVIVEIVKVHRGGGFFSPSSIGSSRFVRVRPCMTVGEF
jgi:hypothetical protein